MRLLLAVLLALLGHHTLPILLIAWRIGKPE